MEADDRELPVWSLLDIPRVNRAVAQQRSPLTFISSLLLYGIL
jgi:hypothetical protein